MIFADFSSFAEAIPANAPLVGLDLGSKTIGVAVSDVRRVVATPLETISRRKATRDAGAVRQIAEERSASGIVLGLPINMDGSEGSRCQSTRAFARVLSGAFDGPIGFWDERLSSVAAERSLLEGGLSRRRRAELVNHVAALIILQGALDRLNMMANKR